MSTLEIIAVAYVVAGIYYLWRDFREPLWNRPSFLYNPLRWILVVAIWSLLAVTGLGSHWERSFRKSVASLAIFVGLATGLYLGSLYWQ